MVKEITNENKIKRETWCKRLNVSMCYSYEFTICTTRHKINILICMQDESLPELYHNSRTEI